MCFMANFSIKMFHLLKVGFLGREVLCIMEYLRFSILICSSFLDHLPGNQGEQALKEGNGEIFVGGAYDGELELQKILPNLAPADGPVKLDEVGFAVHAEPHGPAVLHVAEDLALHGERVTEGVLAPGFLKGVGEIELFHAETPVSAAGGGT